MATKEDEMRADRAMHAMHRELYPEKYPGWDFEEDGECFEWDSGTIEPIAHRICSYVERPAPSDDEVRARDARRIGYIYGRYATGDLTAAWDGEQYIAIEQDDDDARRLALTVHDAFDQIDTPDGWTLIRVFDMHSWTEVMVLGGEPAAELRLGEVTVNV